MKAISIKQPWAWTICRGYKDIENRSWPTNYRGPVLIHAGKTVDIDALEFLFFFLSANFGGDPVDYLQQYMKERAFGAIVGSAKITDCVQQSSSPWFSGPYGFTLAEPKIIKPIPYRGQLSFFDVPDELLRGTPQ